MQRAAKQREDVRVGVARRDQLESVRAGKESADLFAATKYERSPPRAFEYARLSYVGEEQVSSGSDRVHDHAARAPYTRRSIE